MRPTGVLLRALLPRVVPLLGLLVLAAGPAARADEAAARIYVRDLGTVEKAVDRLAAEARRARVAEVLVVFERIAFRPPPGRSEYRYDYDFAGDLEAWLEAIGAWGAKAKLQVRVAVPDQPETWRVGDGDWKGDCRRELEREWWDDPGIRRFEPALDWVRRWRPKGRTKKAPGFVVYVASEWTPENWAGRAANGGAAPAAWRRKLLGQGEHFDEEAIGTTLARAHCPLWVVAPEVRFGHEVPFATRPSPPWASRPQRPPPDMYGALGADEDEAWDRLLRKDLERDLKAEYPDPVERKKVIDEILGKGEGAEEGGPDGESRSVPADRAPDDGVPAGAGRGGRYTSGPPSLFPRFGGRSLFVNDVPSGFGHWPYARAAFASGGRYLLYPFGPSRWLDRCPRDGRKLSRHAPSLAARTRIAGEHTGDRALDAMCRATALVLARTPWTDEGGSRAATAWSAFASAAPVRLASGYEVRRFPSDPFVMGKADALKGEAPNLKRLVTRYDQALVLLDAALAAAKPGKDGWPHRSVADLHLARFEFAMSAFHLAEVTLALQGFERLVPEGWDSTNDDYILSHLPVIKMSDGLDAYDGKKISASNEAHYTRAIHRAYLPPGAKDGPGRWETGQVVPGQLGNVLRIAPGSPHYRAKRDLEAVLKHMDPSLTARARDLVESGRRVMRRYAKTPWGWTVYYAEVQGFVYDPIDGDLDVRPRTGDDEDRDVPFSPTRPGSTPGGPTSGR